MIRCNNLMLCIKYNPTCRQWKSSIYTSSKQCLPSVPPAEDIPPSPPQQLCLLTCDNSVSVTCLQRNTNTMITLMHTSFHGGVGGYVTSSISFWGEAEPPEGRSTGDHLRTYTLALSPSPQSIVARSMGITSIL